VATLLPSEDVIREVADALRGTVLATFEDEVLFILSHPAVQAWLRREAAPAR
jgi:hypothetical protein